MVVVLAFRVLVVAAILIAAFVGARRLAAWHHARIEQRAVRSQLSGFGLELQKVPLSDPTANLGEAMQDNYAPYVDPSLLAAWEADPTTAPGAEAPSPWPKDIQVATLSLEANGNYAASGTVEEITSVEEANGGVAAAYSFTAELSDEAGTWMIVSFDKGPYVK